MSGGKCHQRRGRPNKLSPLGQDPGQGRRGEQTRSGTITSGDQEAIRGIIPGDIPSSSHAGQQGHMLTVPSVRLPVHVPQSSIPGQKPGKGAANNIHEFDYQVPRMPVDSIHTLFLSSNMS